MSKATVSFKHRISLASLVLVCGFLAYRFLEKNSTGQQQAPFSQPLTVNPLVKDSEVATENLQTPISSASATVANFAAGSDCLEKVEHELFAGENHTQYQKRLKQALRSSVGEWFYIANAAADLTQIQSKSEKFFYALASANLLIGLKTKVPLNHDLALKLLTEVYSEDRNNSAPLLYAAIVYEQLGKFSVARELINRALEQSTYFDTYVLNFSRTLALASESAEDFYRSTTILASHPVPDHLKLRDLILKYKLRKISEQLIQDALDKNKLLAEYEWSLIDYTIGVATLKKLSPEYKLPRFQDLMSQKNRMNDFNPEKFFEEFQKNCDMKFVENEFLFLKSRLNRN